MRKIYKLTDEGLVRMREIASRPVMFLPGGRPMFNPQQEANDFWKDLGKKGGFEWDTVGPAAGKGHEYFEAEESPAAAGRAGQEDKTSKCWMTEKCSRPADTRLCAPNGRIIGPYCREHAEAAVVEYRKKLGEIWSIEKAEIR